MARLFLWPLIREMEAHCVGGLQEILGESAVRATRLHRPDVDAQASGGAAGVEGDGEIFSVQIGELCSSNHFGVSVYCTSDILHGIGQ